MSGGGSTATGAHGRCLPARHREHWCTAFGPAFNAPEYSQQWHCTRSPELPEPQAPGRVTGDIRKLVPIRYIPRIHNPDALCHDFLMTFRGDVSRSGGNARKGGGGRGMAVGGGIGGLLLVGLFLLFGGDPGQVDEILGGQNNQGQLEAGGQGNFDHCQTGADANANDDCRLYYTSFSVNEVWDRVLPAQAGLQYREPGLEIFTNTTQSGCGMASAATGPFYCPADQYAYFDLTFFEQMRQFGGENAPLSQMYIVAHEFGHHVQNLEGTLGLSDYNNPGADSNAVKLELQADCYAGIWASYADKGADRMLEPITEAELDTALTTAGAVGDDNIQRRSGGEVNPESWTHGSSQQRKDSFLAGYNSGQMSSCDFLGRGVYQNS